MLRRSYYDLYFHFAAFPENFQNFILRLRDRGVTVLGIADEPYDALNPALKEALTEYYRVNDMYDYDQMVRACGYFTHKYGKIDRIESHIEHWLELDAALRSDFNVFGLKREDMNYIKNKSGMKEVFRRLNIPVAEGRVFEDEKDAFALAKELGYPVCVKPDAGVGAADTHKIKTEEQLKEFLEKRADIPYIMEEFLEGTVLTFDGLADGNGEIVFSSSLTYGENILDNLDSDADMYYYIFREVAADLAKYGQRCIVPFNLAERFFHIEFFREKRDGQLKIMEINCRPPGGFTMDMFNYANDIDMYAEYANIVTGKPFSAKVTRPYYCGYVSRKRYRNYLHSREDIADRYAEAIVSHIEMRMSSVILWETTDFWSIQNL